MTEMAEHICPGQTEDLEFVNLPLHKAYLLKSFIMENLKHTKEDRRVQ